MIQYSADGNVAFYDGYKFRCDPNTGYYLCTKKTDAGRRERLHVYVWRKSHGEIKPGYHVHHMDKNKRNNELENLVCIKGEAHVSLHGSERAQNDYDGLCKILAEKAVPKSKEWHSSAKGKAWHSEHAKEMYASLEKKEHVCQVCGKKYKAFPVGGKKKFCSNSCKATARRKSGVDNEKRICEYCGNQFITNKYSKSKTCSPKCASAIRFSKEHKAD